MQIVFTSDLRFTFKIKPQSAHPVLPIAHLQWSLWSDSQLVAHIH